MATDFDQMVLLQAPGAVIVCNRRGNVAHWSPGAEQVCLGMPLKKPSAIRCMN
jgi:hypothetical protein